MTSVLIGLLLVVIGLLIAPTGEYTLIPVVGLVVLISLYLGFSIDDHVVLETLNLAGYLDSVPFAPDLIGGIADAFVILWIIGLGWGIAGTVLPAAYGFQLGMSVFGESILTLILTFIGGISTLLFFAFIPFAASAIIGAASFGVGVQFMFSVTTDSADPFAGFAGWLRSDAIPDIIPDIIYAIGSIIESPLLTVLTLFVALLGLGGRLLLFKLI